MVLFGYKEEGRESCLARKTFWEMKTAVTSGCTGMEQKFPSAHEGLSEQQSRHIVSVAEGEGLSRHKSEVKVKAKTLNSFGDSFIYLFIFWKEAVKCKT